MVPGNEGVGPERPALVVEGAEEARPARHEDDEKGKEKQAGDLTIIRMNQCTLEICRTKLSV